MSSLLLDTCTFLWIISDERNQLSEKALSLFQDPANDAYLSAASFWEIVIKYQTGKLPLPEPPERYLPAQRERHGIESLPIQEDEVLALHRLPDFHKDPFDRLLVCQAIVRQMTILTPDDQIRRYAVLTEW